MVRGVVGKVNREQPTLTCAGFEVVVGGEGELLFFRAFRFCDDYRALGVCRKRPRLSNHASVAEYWTHDNRIGSSKLRRLVQNYRTTFSEKV